MSSGYFLFTHDFFSFSFSHQLKFLYQKWGGGGGKALTMTMTHRNIPGPLVKGQKIYHDHDTLDFAHGQWSKLTNFDHLTTVILKFWPWLWSKTTNFYHLTTAILKFWPWSWSKIFDHVTMTPGRRPNGQTKRGHLTPLPQFATVNSSSLVIRY